jgi:type IV secretion system protein VirB10
MDPVSPTPDPPHTPTGARGVILDRQPALRGGLPRQTQTWVMVGIALVILGVIVLTGRPTSDPRGPAPAAIVPPAGITPERVRDYQARLAEQEARLQQELATPLTVSPESVQPEVVVPEPIDPVEDERRRRDYASLFADNVAFSRRAAAVLGAPTTTESAVLPPFPYPMVVPAPPVPSPPLVTAPADQRLSPIAAAPEVSATAATPAPAATTPIAATPSDRLQTLLEGTVIETVLMNRLDGTFQGPVQCLVTTPVYAQHRQAVVIPAGARVLGSAAPVQAWGDSRLAVTFHRLIMPDGHTYTLDSFTGLNQVGETGLRDEVDRHYLQVFGASLAIGAISGLAQFGTRGSFEASFPDAARQSTGASLATSTARVLDRYLNVLPTITIREGHRIKVVLTNDLVLTAYTETDAAPRTRPPTSRGVFR